MKYEVIMLDVDNTLLDFNKAAAYALRKTCEAVGYPYSEAFKKEYEYYNHKLWESLEKGEIDMATLKSRRFKEIVEKYHIKATHTQMSYLYMDHLGEATFEMEGAFLLCEKLSKYCKLVTMTNGISKVQRDRFKSSRLGQFISEQFISEEIGVSKPDPAIFEHALKVLDINDKRKVLMVGDSLSSDMQGGLNAGIDTCFFNPHGLEMAVKVTYQVKSLSEIIPIVTG